MLVLPVLLIPLLFTLLIPRSAEAYKAASVPQSTDVPAEAPPAGCTAGEFPKAMPRDDEEAAERLALLAPLFPNGMYWNHMNAGAQRTLFDVTDTPCVHDAHGEAYCNGYSGLTSAFFPTSGDNIQCLAYASLLGDFVFGQDAEISEHSDPARIRVGDHIRLLYADHSVVVTAIEGETLSVTEVNRSWDDCLIEWNRTIELYTLYEEPIRVLTRWPAEEEAVQAAYSAIGMQAVVLHTP